MLRSIRRTLLAVFTTNSRRKARCRPRRRLNFENLERRELLSATPINDGNFEVPVLASDVGGVSEIVRQGETGLLHRPGDVADLARGLDRLLSLTPAEAGTMTDRAAAETRSVRDVHGYVATYEHLLRGLAKDPGASPRQLVAER